MLCPPFTLHYQPAYVIMNDFNHQFFFCIRFFSNYLGGGLGFQLAYESTNAFHEGMANTFDDCGGYFSSTNGTLYSPSYPDSYPSNMHCIYTINQPTGNIIQLNFLNFEIMLVHWGHTMCSGDFLEIRDGPSSGSPLLEKLCGSTIPAPLQSSQNRLWMR